MKRLGLVVLAALALSVPAAGTPTGAPGITPTQILIGGTVPLSGTASAFGAVGPSANAYFKYVNAHGGVFGRKIKYLYRDDGYDPARTLEETRRMVEQDKVFAIFNTVGTEHTIAIRGYLNALGVPELFAGTGAARVAHGYKQYKWTMGYLPSFEGEGKIYGHYVVKHRPKARIAVLYENSDYGQDLLRGLRRGLGKHAKQIVATQSYEVTDSSVRSQIARLRASHANTFMLFALPFQAIQAFQYAYGLGWFPRFFVSAVSIEPTIMSIARQNTHGRETNGALSFAFVKDPTSPAWKKDPAVALYKKILKRYDKGGRVSDVYNWYGMTVAYSMVDALKHAGRNPTRASLLRAVTHMNERTNPFLLPGVGVKTSPTNYFPIAKARMVRYQKTLWVLFGPLVRPR